MADETRDQVPLLLLIAFLVRWRRLLVAVPLAAALLTGGISYLVPARYASTAVVRLPKGAGTGIILGDEPEAVCLSLLYSRWMCERVITHFDLPAVYGLRAAPVDAVMMTLLRRVTFVVNDTSRNILITVEDRSPRRAREMADYYVTQLDLRNQELQALRARDEYRFISTRLAETEATLRHLEDSLCHYGTEAGVFDLSAQVQTTLRAAASLEAEHLIISTRRELARQIYGTTSANTEYWRLYTASLDSALQGLLRAREPVERQFLLTLDAIPREQWMVVRLQREIAAYGELTGYLLELRELARIDTERDVSTLIRLDTPAEARLKFWPRRRLMVMLAAAVTFVFTAVAASFYETMVTATRNADHPLHGQVARIRRAWTARQ